MTEREEWQCEQCNGMFEVDPATKKTVPGYDGPIELWFCEDCSNE